MTPHTDLRVLVVDDDFHVARLHCQAVAATPGFAVLPAAGSAKAARVAINEARPELVLLDVYLPDTSGLDLLRELDCDVFVLSAASDGATVRRALRRGALGYLIKPFPAEHLTDLLQAYARYRNVLNETAVLDQKTIDKALRILHSGDGKVPRTRSATEQTVLDALAKATDELSALEIAQLVGVSRATAQRYLAGLAGSGLARVQLQYGVTGRPEHRYSLR
jgi:two-component system CitB family response regulator